MDQSIDPLTTNGAIYRDSLTFNRILIEIKSS